MKERGQRDVHIERGTRVGRRAFLAMGGAGLAVAGLPRAVRGQAKPSGEIVAGVSERALTLDPANHYSISATSVLRHVFDPHQTTVRCMKPVENRPDSGTMQRMRSPRLRRPLP